MFALARSVLLMGVLLMAHDTADRETFTVFGIFEIREKHILRLVIFTY
jgi:hypothetical protein